MILKDMNKNSKQMLSSLALMFLISALITVILFACQHFIASTIITSIILILGLIFAILACISLGGIISVFLNHFTEEKNKSYIKQYLVYDGFTEVFLTLDSEAPVSLFYDYLPIYKAKLDENDAIILRVENKYDKKQVVSRTITNYEWFLSHFDFN